MLTSNYHTHTSLCDGRDTPEEMLAYALELNMTHLGFSGHMDQEISMDVKEYYDRIRELKRKFSGRIDILTGIELDTLFDPSCAYDAEYIIGSTHYLDVQAPPSLSPSVDNTPQDLAALCTEFYEGDYYQLAKAYYELESQVVDRLHCTFIGHFDLVVRFNDECHFLDETDPRYLNPALEAMEYLVSKQVPFEINCGAVNRGRKKELYPHPLLLKALREFGGEIIISSDAHQKELLLGGFDAAVLSAVRCGFTHTNILEHDSGGRVVFRQVPLDALL